jgi:hypothetical protein
MEPGICGKQVAAIEMHESDKDQALSPVLRTPAALGGRMAKTNCSIGLPSSLHASTGISRVQSRQP